MDNRKLERLEKKIYDMELRGRTFRPTRIDICSGPDGEVAFSIDVKDNKKQKGKKHANRRVS